METAYLFLIAEDDELMFTEHRMDLAGETMKRISYESVPVNVLITFDVYKVEFTCSC